MESPLQIPAARAYPAKNEFPPLLRVPDRAKAVFPSYPLWTFLPWPWSCSIRPNLICSAGVLYRPAQYTSVPDSSALPVHKAYPHLCILKTDNLFLRRPFQFLQFPDKYLSRWFRVLPRHRFSAVRTYPSYVCCPYASAYAFALHWQKYHFPQLLPAYSRGTRTPAQQSPG